MKLRKLERNYIDAITIFSFGLTLIAVSSLFDNSLIKQLYIVLSIPCFVLAIVQLIAK